MWVTRLCSRLVIVSSAWTVSRFARLCCHCLWSMAFTSISSIVGHFRLILFVWLMTAFIAEIVECCALSLMHVDFSDVCVCTFVRARVSACWSAKIARYLRDTPLVHAPLFPYSGKVGEQIIVYVWIYGCVHDGEAIHLSCVHAHSVWCDWFSVCMHLCMPGVCMHVSL